MHLKYMACGSLFLAQKITSAMALGSFATTTPSSKASIVLRTGNEHLKASGEQCVRINRLSTCSTVLLGASLLDRARVLARVGVGFQIPVVGRFDEWLLPCGGWCDVRMSTATNGKYK